MKARSIVFSLMALCYAMVAKAQSDQISATLQTGNVVSVYLGSNALINAYNDAADEGSIITLTSGTFATPTNIQKSITIYGTGWEEDTSNGIKPSVINGSLNIFSGSDDTNLKQVTLEGVSVGDISIKQINNLYIKKCGIYNFNIYGNNAKNADILQSKINVFYGEYKIAGLNFQNCCIYHMRSATDDSQIWVDHCIITGEQQTCKALYTNCIIPGNSGFTGGVVLKDCIIGRSAVTGVESEHCWWKVNMSTLFSDVNNVYYAAGRTYELQDPSTYTSSDGSVVGLTGGLGWNRIPSTPVVKSLQLGVNGSNLNVTYEAETRN